MDDSPSSLVAAALQAKPSTRLGGIGSGSPGESQLVETYLARIDVSASELKTEVFDLIKEKYQEFQPLFHDSTEMSSKVQRLSKDMDSLSNRIQASCKPALHDASQRQSKLKGRLEECNEHIALLSELLAVYDEFEGAQKDQHCSNYISSAKRLKQANEHLQQTMSRGCDAQIYLSLKDELHRQRASLLGLLRSVWSQAFKFSVTKPASGGSSESAKRSDSSQRSTQAPMKLELNGRLAVPSGRDITLTLLVQCLELLGVLDEMVSELGLNLVKYFLVPTISFQVKTSVATSSRSFAVTLAEITPEVDSQQRPADVYSSVQELFDTISRFLSPCDDDVSTLLKDKIGAAVWQKMCDSIVKKCLAQAVPSQAEQMKSFGAIVNATQAFESAMASGGFVPEGGASLLSKYVANVNVHFASKKCEDLLTRARSLMVTDLHNTVQLVPQTIAALRTPSDTTASPSTTLSFDEKRTEAELSLAEGVLHMPRCRVSVFVQDLVQLARDTLQEATRSSVESAIQLFFSVRNVFELYPLVVPTFHKRAVSEVPLLAAIQHNNSFYLAHQLLTLGHQFRSQLSAKSWLNDAAAFVDLVPSIRRVGEECLVSQLRRQHNDLLSSLEGAHQFTMATDEKRCADIRRALRQVIHQLGRLAAVWRDVLPREVFLRSIALLMDAVVNSVVSSIVSLEDVSASEAIALHTELAFLRTELPPLLSMEPEPSTSATASDKTAPSPSSTDTTRNTGGGKSGAGGQLVPITESELSKLVMHWDKFTYLLTLLDANLQMFIDLWKHGKGPIASLYSGAEVRRLIRALFQNTERRSNALATIRVSGS